MDVEKQLLGIHANKEKVKQLFKSLVLAYQRHSRKRKTVELVHEQIHRVKQVAIARAPKQVVEQEIATLHEMITSLLEKEKALLMQQSEESKMLTSLKTRLDAI